MQKCLIITEDDRIVESALQVEKKGYMVDHGTSEAWMLHPGSLVKKRGTSVQYALVDERDAAPFFLNGHSPTRKEIKGIINNIAKESRKEAMYEIHSQQIKDRLGGVFKFIALMFAITTVVLIIALLLFSGNLSWPW